MNITKLSILFWRMLRYRVAIMLILFYLISTAAHGALTLHINHTLLILALLFSYVSATTINDLVDKDIDKINHPTSKGRPLITGEATEKDLRIIHAISSSVSILLAFIVSIPTGIIILISIAINYLYSAPPLKLSHRTYFAHLFLALAYVVIPYSLGYFTVNSTQFNWLLLVSLFFLFLGRIVLKDFRDRKGDATYGKPTLILRHGKNVTCFVSFTAILIATIFLWSTLNESLYIKILFLLPIMLVISILYRLWNTSNEEQEQTFIGIGAKVGNGLLISLLGIYLLNQTSATTTSKTIILGLLVSIFLLNGILLLRNPSKAVIGYRG